MNGEEIQTGEKAPLRWEPIRDDNEEDVRAAITLEAKMFGNEPYFGPPDEILTHKKPEGLFLRRGKDVVGQIRIAPDEFTVPGTFPESTLVLNYMYILPEAQTPQLLRSAREALREYAATRGCRNIGWYSSDFTLQPLSGVATLAGEPGFFTVPLNAFNDTVLERIQKTAHRATIGTH